MLALDGGLAFKSMYSLPPNLYLVTQGGVLVLQTDKAKAWPPDLKLEYGFSLAFHPDVVLKHPKQAMYPFTREFPHPTDWCSKASPEAQSRFHADHRRFPPAAYERGNLAWKGWEWRTLTPAERANVHGIPKAVVEQVGLGLDRAAKTAAHNSAIGNSLHTPSVLVALLLLFQLGVVTNGEAQLPAVWLQPRSLLDKEEQGLLARYKASVFDLSSLRCVEQLLSPKQVVDDMKAQLSQFEVPAAVYSKVLVGLQEPWGCFHAVVLETAGQDRSHRLGSPTALAAAA